MYGRRVMEARPARGPQWRSIRSRVVLRHGCRVGDPSEALGEGLGAVRGSRLRTRSSRPCQTTALGCGRSPLAGGVAAGRAGGRGCGRPRSCACSAWRSPAPVSRWRSCSSTILGAAALRSRVGACSDPRQQHVRRGGGRAAPRSRAVDVESRVRPARPRVVMVAEGDRGDRGPPVLVAAERDQIGGDRPAAVANYRAGKTVQGGSTLTQQLVRDRYLGVPWAPTLARKLKEACLAATARAATTPSGRSSQAYLNQVYYGHHAYGAQAAAEDLLLAVGAPADDHPGRVACRTAAGPVGV